MKRPIAASVFAVLVRVAAMFFRVSTPAGYPGPGSGFARPAASVPRPACGFATGSKGSTSADIVTGCGYDAPGTLPIEGPAAVVGIPDNCIGARAGILISAGISRLPCRAPDLRERIWKG